MKAAYRRTSEPLGVKIPSQNRAAAPSLELFQKETCPFSHAVRNHLSRLGLDFIAHTVPDESTLKQEMLVQAGGKNQIPFLVDHRSGVKLYESSAIIAYLDKEYGKPILAPIAQRTRNLGLRIQARSDQLAWALRSPFERARILVEDMGESLKSLRDSYRSVRQALQTPIPSERPDSDLSRAA